MKFIRFISIFLVLASLVCLAGCGASDSAATASTDSATDLSEGSSVKTDKTVITCQNGRIIYKWTVSDWNKESYNGFPVLTKNADGMQCSFAVMDVRDGVPDDFVDYATEVMGQYFKDRNVSSYRMAGGPVNRFTDKNYEGITTGYYRNDADTDSTVAVVYALSDGSCSAVIGVVLTGEAERITALHDRNFAGNTDNHIIDGYAKEILDSFTFG